MALLSGTGGASYPQRLGAFARAGVAARGLFDSVPPPGLILLGIVSVQVGAGLAKNLFAVLPPGAVVLLRLLTAAVVLLAFARPKPAGRSWRDLALAGTFGVSLAFMNFAIYQSFARIPLGIAVTVEFLGPLAVAVAASRRKLDLLWALLAGGGVLMLAKGGSVEVVGVLWALLAGCAWAAYILFSAAVGRRFSGSSGLTIAMCVGTVAMLPAGVWEGGSALLKPEYLAIGAGVGLLSSAIPYALEMEALRRVPPKVFSILMSLEPAVAALVGVVLLGEILGARQWLAIGCVVAASIGSTRTARGAPPPES